MAKTLLIAGKEFPEGADFASTAVSFRRKVALTVQPETPKPTHEKFQALEWRKHSPVSARALILETENLFQQIHEAALIFDLPRFARLYPLMSTKECAKALDDMITGYTLLTAELLFRFDSLEKIKNTGEKRLIFVLREAAADRATVPDQEDGILPALGRAAFRALAEGTAEKCKNWPSVSALLVETDALTDDVALGARLFPYLDNLPPESSPSRRTQWLKWGAKSAGGLSFFKK
jgi:hypothetical protein